MSKRLRRGCITGAAIGSAILCLAGCGGPYDSKVSGKVTIDGAVVSNGTVAFSPVSGGPAAYGKIEPTGDYVIQTGREQGLPAGDYQVAVTANEPAKMNKTETGGPPPPGKALTPAWYRSKNNLGIEVHCEEGLGTLLIWNLNRSRRPAGSRHRRGASWRLAASSLQLRNEKWDDGFGTKSERERRALSLAWRLAIAAGGVRAGYLWAAQTGRGYVPAADPAVV